MATEIETAGYESLRAFVTSTDGWTHWEARDETDEAITRLEIDTDTRAAWTTTETEQTQTLEVTLSGSDADIGGTDGDALPVTIAGGALYATETGGDVLHTDTFAGATLELEGDEVTIQHDVQIPQV